MTSALVQALQKKNAILWITAMVIPAVFDLGFKAFASGPVNFPWSITIPFLFIGLMLASNKLIEEATGAEERD